MALIGDEQRSGALADAVGVQYRVPIDIRLYRQRTTMAQVAESVWRLATDA